MPLPESTDPQAFKAFEERSWNAAAGIYHAQFGRLTAQVAPALLEAARVSRSTRLLDLASGPGYVAGLAASRGAVVTGLDVSPEMVELARRNFPGVEFQLGDAEALAFGDGRFDAVTMAFLLGHLARPGDALVESRRVLRPGGRLALAWWGPPERAVAFQIMMESIRAKGRVDVGLPPAPAFDHFSNESALRGALEEVGFAEVEVREEALAWSVADGEALFDAYLLGTARTAGLLREQTPEERLAIRAEVVERSRAYAGARGLELPMPALVASAERRA